MPRKGPPSVRELNPDPIYRSTLVTPRELGGGSGRDAATPAAVPVA